MKPVKKRSMRLEKEEKIGSEMTTRAKSMPSTGSLPQKNNQTDSSSSLIDNSIYWLTWNTKSDHFSSELSKLYQSGENLMGLTDVTLCSSEGQFIQAHKLVLSLCSPFFRRLFLQASRAERTNPMVVLANIKLQHLRYLLQFFYDGEVDVPAGELDEFLKIGNMLQIEGLSGYIKTFGAKASAEQRRNDEYEDLSSIRVGNPISLADNHERLQSSKNNDSKSKGNSFSNSNSWIEQDADESLNVEEGECNSASADVDDQNSNFSDEMEQEHDDVSDGEPDGDGNSNKKNGKARTGKQTWEEIEITEEELSERWRRLHDRQHSAKFVRYYYCAQGYTCACRIKREVFLGKTMYYYNRREHNNHRKERFGLTHEQKDFINKLQEMGVKRASDIVRAMKQENMEVPEDMKIKNYLARIRKKLKLDSPYEIKAKKTPTSSSSTTLGKSKRGRPRKSAKMESEQTTPSTSNIGMSDTCKKEGMIGI